MNEFPPVPQLTPEQDARRRRRSVALGLFLAALVLLFYVVSMVKIAGSAVTR